MGICLDELRLQVIRPTLKHLRAWSQGMENLLLGTAAQESQLGFHLKQGRRHGLGIYQIQPHTHREIWDQYLIDHPTLASKVRGLASQRDFLDHPHSELTTNLRYATAIAWLIYRSADVHKLRETEAPDVANMARLWHQHFHHGPSASTRDFECSYAQLVSGADPTDSAPRYTGAPLPEHPPASKNSPGAGLNGQDARQPTA
ncbi:hypothetical protein MO867_08780 [Microbulbifer sp. OS29]|uniref:Uncharacterized protein n=1 Tax=Microbulbifer okhotskensis TaxID=2926617 RepID=A0A9X2EMJ2_9GAMM|nr:hypothetical protein [Microbulbifer okhotskensis]MCO1334434.1 hypothetical protein [Microbulbifer okhotskensis]